MKFKRITSIILAALMAVSASGIAGCGSKPDAVKSLTLKGLLKSVNAKNEEFLKRDTSFDEAEYTADYEEPEFSEDEVKALFSMNYNNVTKEEAKEDVDTLFRVLKSLYAGYTYFGGDEAFNAAKEAIKVDIDACEKKKINQQIFADIITKNLEFVKDSHFLFNGKQCFDEAHTFYESSRMNFFETKNGYFTEIDEVRYYLPQEYEKYLKVTIAESGELVYGIFAVVTDDEKAQLPVKIDLVSDSDTKTVDIEWVLSEVGGEQAAHAQYTEVDSVAISSLSGMMLDEYNFTEMNDFLNNSEKHAEHKYSILDLRKNGGGMAEIDQMWISGYTGKKTDMSYPLLSFNGGFYEKFSEYIPSVDMEEYGKLDMMSEESVTSENVYLENVITYDGLFDDKPEEMISNPNTLFVLQSKRGYSASEVFAMMLDSVENVLSVGTNTNGCIRTGCVMDLSLPNSGLTLRYSTAIFAGLDKEFDVYGLEPDIYIADDNAQDAVLRCIKYYS